MSSFARRLIEWQHRHGRHDLPWQQTKDPYRVWLSEIMLQQTQVTTVIGYYQRFLEHFPDLPSLAAAPTEAVMAQWSGLGYYARARNLHACAHRVMTDHRGSFPSDPDQIADLPGIGRSTANAIAVFCFGARRPILDGNVKRLLCRCFGIEGFPGTAAVESRLWQHADALLPTREVDVYVQAQMDLGATVCTRGKPACHACPVADLCIAHRDGRTADLPTPRPRRALPEREATMLVLYSADAVLLEERPPKGIWGGLLSLPELPANIADDEVPTYCRENLGLGLGAVSPAPTFTHTFTHFRLHVRPLLGAIASGETAPLPAPVRSLLNRLSETL
jgi:A/G-specific adenine glycosylase